MNYSYNSYPNNFGRNYNMPMYAQPQYAPQVQQMPQQQMVQPQPQPQQPMQYEMPIQYVGNATLKETEAYILFPNQKALFIDKANGMVYEKVCGVDGQSEITHYKRIDFNAQNQAIEPQNTQPAIDLSNYAKKDDLTAFASVEQYNQLLNKVEQLQKQIGSRNNAGTKTQQQ